MRISVIGPGAIGCLLAAYLARAGEQVSLLDYRPERAALLNAKGITVHGVREDFHTNVKATTDTAEISSAAVLIVCVKACNTAAVASLLKDAISSESHLLTLQNGLGNVEKLGEFFPSHRIFAGVTSNGATLLGVGRVRHAGYGEIWVGEGIENSSTPVGQRKLQNLVAVLDRAGLKAQLVDDIQTVLWRKLVVNVGINALTAVLGVANGVLLEIPQCQDIVQNAVTETVQVAHCYGVHLDATEEIDRVREVCSSTAANISSMLQDVNQKKKTEIDYINGAVVRMAARRGRVSPVNQVLTALVQSLETGYLR
ncbi:MAG: 2-dehydropantoate 2-reductase [Deltaproteobacteria bacterium]|nr:MAG: 2-dehydropantoate 2-reductase [Deltaproteobacteria bacterium]